MDLTLPAVWGRLQEIARDLAAALPTVLIALGVFLIFWFVAGLLSGAVIAVVRRAGQPRHVGRVFGRLIRWVVITFGLLVAVTITFPSLNAATLFSTLGVGGIAIGFAFRDIFQNLLSGLILLVTRPFRIGDQIVSGSAEGTVEDVWVRATVIRTADQRRVLVPNAELFSGRVTVNTAYPRARATFSLTLPHGADFDRALEVIGSVLPGLEGVLPSPAPDVIATGLTGAGLTLSVRFWVSPPERRELALTTHTVILAVSGALNRAGVRLESRQGSAAPPAPTTEAEPSGRSRRD